MRSLRRPVWFRGVEQMGESGTERCGAEGNEIVIEITVLGSDDGGGDARPRAASGEAFWTLLTKVETSCDRILIAGGANVEAEWEQGPAV